MQNIERVEKIYTKKKIAPHFSQESQNENLDFDSVCSLLLVRLINSLNFLPWPQVTSIRPVIFHLYILIILPLKSVLDNENQIIDRKCPLLPGCLLEKEGTMTHGRH